MIVSNQNSISVESRYTPTSVNSCVSEKSEAEIAGYEELQAFLTQPPREIRHPVLMSTLHNPKLEQRIM